MFVGPQGHICFDVQEQLAIVAVVNSNVTTFALVAVMIRLPRGEYFAAISPSSHAERTDDSFANCNVEKIGRSKGWQ